MATKQAAERPEVAPLITKLGLDADSDTGRWVQQCYEDGVDDKDVLYTLAEAESVHPQRFRRVSRD